jgi:hypothetical protein
MTKNDFQHSSRLSISFLDLPVELRLVIYHYAFPAQELAHRIATRSYGWRKHDLRLLALRLVSKQIREEAAPVFFKQNSFTIDPITSVSDLPG